MGELYLKIRNNEKLSKEFIEFMSEKIRVTGQRH